MSSKSKVEIESETFISQLMNLLLFASLWNDSCPQTSIQIEDKLDLNLSCVFVVANFFPVILELHFGLLSDTFCIMWAFKKQASK